MKYRKQDLPKILALSLVLLAVVIYIAVSFSKLSAKAKLEEREHQALHEAAETSAIGADQGLSPTAAAEVAAIVNPVAPPVHDPFEPIIPPRQQYSTATTVTTPRSRRPLSLPPLLPPLTTGIAGTGLPTSFAPASETLRLTGVIVGLPSIAVLRRGEDHYILQQGDVLDGRYRILSIGPGSVTLKDGKNSRVLRLGG